MIKGLWLMLAGGVSLMVTLALRSYTWHGYHLSTLHGLCSSWLGQWGQAASPQVAAKCTLAGAAEQAAGWSLVLGVAALVLGGVLAYRGRAPGQ